MREDERKTCHCENNNIESIPHVMVEKQMDLLTLSEVNTRRNSSCIPVVQNKQWGGGGRGEGGGLQVRYLYMHVGYRMRSLVCFYLAASPMTMGVWLIAALLWLLAECRIFTAVL